MALFNDQNRRIVTKYIINNFVGVVVIYKERVKKEIYKRCLNSKDELR
jgi:hypothetical protein